MEKRLSKMGAKGFRDETSLTTTFNWGGNRRNQRIW